VFFPFSIFFVLFILATTFIYEEHAKEASKSEEKQWDKYQTINLILAILMAPFLIFSVYLEVKQAWKRVK
jgi:hypothetical protein